MLEKVYVNQGIQKNYISTCWVSTGKKCQN